MNEFSTEGIPTIILHAFLVSTFCALLISPDVITGTRAAASGRSNAYALRISVMAPSRAGPAAADTPLLN